MLARRGKSEHYRAASPLTAGRLTVSKDEISNWDLRSGTSDDDKCNREQTSLLIEHPSTSPQGDVDTEKLMQVMGETVRPERA